MTAAFALAAIFVRTPGGVAGHVLLAVGIFVLGLYRFAKCGVGGGVVKFFTASSLWIGPNGAFLAFAAITAVGGVLLVLVVEALRGKVRSVPYSLVVLVAFLFSLPHSPMWHAMMGRLHGSA